MRIMHSIMSISQLQNIDQLKTEVRKNQRAIHQNIPRVGNKETPRTQSKNIKFPAQTVKAER